MRTQQDAAVRRPETGLGARLPAKPPRRVARRREEALSRWEPATLPQRGRGIVVYARGVKVGNA